MAADRETFVFDTDPARLDLDRVHEWLSTDAYWAKGRPREVVEQAAANSLNIGAYRSDGEQVAYGRLATDRTTFAWLCDVYVPPQWRGHGLGLGVAQAARKACEDLGIRRMLLVTGDAHGVYEKVGFEPLPDPERWMVLSLQRLDFTPPQARAQLTEGTP